MRQVSSGLLDHSRRPHQSPRATDPALVEALVAAAPAASALGGARNCSRSRRGSEPRRGLAESIDRAATLLKRARLGRPAAAPRPSPGRARGPLAPITSRERGLDGRLQRPVSDRRGGPVLLSLHLARRLQSVSAALSGAGLECAPSKRPSTQFLRAFADLWLARVHSQRQWAAVCGRSAWGASPAWTVWWMRLGIRARTVTPPGCPEQNGAHEQFHTHLESRNRAAPGRPKRRRATTSPSTVSGPNTTTSGRMRPWGKPPAGQRLHALAPPLARAPAAARVSRSFRGPPRLAHRPSVLAWAICCFVSGALAGEDVAFEEVDDGLWTLHFASVSRWRASTNVILRFSPIAPFTRGAAPPAPLAPRLS